MSLMLDKKLINVSEGEEDNYKINVADFIKSRHMNDVLNYKINSNTTNQVNNNNNNNNNSNNKNKNNELKLNENTNKNNSTNNKIILNKYSVDKQIENEINGIDDDDDDDTVNTNSVINQGDYRTHFIRKFKENKSRLSSRNQYSAIYVKQPSVEKTWNMNHSNHNSLINDLRQVNPITHSSSNIDNNETSILSNDSNKHVSIGSIEKWSSHISKSNNNNNNNTGLNSNTNNTSNNNNNNTINIKSTTTTTTANLLKQQLPMTYNLLTHVISNPVERENTKESLSMQYDRPIDIHRDLIPTPHAYLKLNDEPININNRKQIMTTATAIMHNSGANQTTTTVPTFTTATLSSISNSNKNMNNSNITSNYDAFILRQDAQTPDTYVTINTPSKNISVYSRLTVPLVNNQNTINTNNQNSNNSNKTNVSNNVNINNTNNLRNRTIAKETINDPAAISKRRSTFSISPHKNANNTTIINTNTTKKSTSFRNPLKNSSINTSKNLTQSSDDFSIVNNEPTSRSTSPKFEEPSISNTDKLFNPVPPSRRAKIIPANTGITNVTNNNNNSTTSSSLIFNKKPLFSQQQQQQQLKSQSNTNISPRKVNFKKKPLQQDKFLKSKFDPNNCELKEFKHCIVTDLKIGEGEFGETFQGYRYDLGAPLKVAAKRLKNLKSNGEIDTNNINFNGINQLNNPNIGSISSNTQNENILAEVCVLSQLGKHDFVIEYLGVHSHETTMYMIFEYAEKGDLKRLLDNCRKNSRPELNINLTWKMKFAYEISCGMEYIASLGIVHKDLAARNILLQKDYTCKIADFGCCKTDFMVRRPIRWMSPESLNKALFTSASDVWAFGILLWEIWTLGVIPYPGMTDDEVVSRINQWYRLYKPHECPNEIYNIMTQCWKEYYRARPRFNQIAHRIKDLYETVLENKGTLPT